MHVHNSQPLFPENIRESLNECEGCRVLLTTPLHLKACIETHLHFPQVKLILCSTATLTRDLALRAEQVFHAQVHEIYGSTETGALATRRTAYKSIWQSYPNVHLHQVDDEFHAHAPYFPEAMVLHDLLHLHDSQRFTIQGRQDDLIKIAGKRASIAGLNHILQSIPGVEDGVFYLPESCSGTQRLMAFVVAPSLSTDQIIGSLRKLIDPVFLPRPLYQVKDLPRNATGKLPKSALKQLAQNKNNS